MQADIAPEKLAKPARQYYIDWLRVLAILIIFTFHSARLFDDDGWHVNNLTTTTGFSIYTGFISGWIMPLFFVLSGAGITWRCRPAPQGSLPKSA